MKKYTHEYFYVPPQGKGKIREKVFLVRITLSIITMIICIMAIGFSAYAYFTATEVTGYATIKSANWELDITCSDQITPTNGVYSLDNTQGTADKTYILTLAKSNYATANSGYAKIEIKTDIDSFTEFQTYYTNPIGDYTVSGIIFTDNSRKIKITVPAEKLAIVKITAEWGSCTFEAFDENLPITPSYAATVQTEKSDPLQTESTTEEQTESSQNKAAQNESSDNSLINTEEAAAENTVSDTDTANTETNNTASAE